MKILVSDLPVFTNFTVQKSWIDENDHMNFGRYFDIFVDASNNISEALGFDDGDFAESGYTTFAGDYHVTFLREARLDDALVCKSYVLSVDHKKMVLRHELSHAEEKWISAIAEELVLSVSLETRKVCPFPEEMHKAMDAVALSEEEYAKVKNTGRFISLSTPGPER
ncbi:MAG: thioesterase family protein [Pseudomonadota bacterium]